MQTRLRRRLAGLLVPALAVAGAGAQPAASPVEPQPPADATRLQLHAASRLPGAGKAKVPYPFTLSSDTGDFSLRVMGMLQFRYLATFRDEDGPGQEGFAYGSELSRTRLGYKGHIGDPSLQFFVWHGWAANGSTLLLDAWVLKDLGNGLKVRAGQFKLPTWHEWYVSETQQQFVERSLLDPRFDELYSQGVDASYTADGFRVIVAVTDGLRSWNDSNKGNQLGLTGRLDVKLAGAWSAKDNFTGFRGGDPAAIIGAAVHVQDGGTEAGKGTANIYTNDTRFFQWTADATLKFDGASLFAAVMFNSEDRPDGTSYDQWGFLVQGGVFISDNTELVARYEHGDLDGLGGAFAAANPGATDSDTLSILTVGVNHFFVGHALKLTVDGGVSFDEVSGAWGGGSRGWIGDDAGAGSQFVLRAQMQLLF